MNTQLYIASIIAAFTLGLTIAATIILVGHDSEDTDHARRRRALGRIAGRARAQTPPVRKRAGWPWPRLVVDERMPRGVEAAVSPHRVDIFRVSDGDHVATRELDLGRLELRDVDLDVRVRATEAALRSGAPEVRGLAFLEAYEKLWGAASCGSRSDDLVCTLPAGHAGVHQCGTTYWSALHTLDVADERYAPGKTPSSATREPGDG